MTSCSQHPWQVGVVTYQTELAGSPKTRGKRGFCLYTASVSFYLFFQWTLSAWHIQSGELGLCSAAGWAPGCAARKSSDLQRDGDAVKAKSNDITNACRRTHYASAPSARVLAPSPPRPPPPSESAPHRYARWPSQFARAVGDETTKTTDHRAPVLVEKFWQIVSCFPRFDTQETPVRATDGNR